MKRLIPIVLLSTALLTGCAETASSTNSHQSQSSTSNKKAATENKPFTLNAKIAHETFAQDYYSASDLSRISNQVGNQVQAYLTSIKNLKNYHVNITSSTTIDYNSGHHVYEATVYLIHK